MKYEIACEKYEEYTLVKIKVIPKSSRSKIGDLIGDRIKVFVTSAPENGKANAEIIKLFSKLLGIAKTKISVVYGEKSQKKNLAILLDMKDVVEKLTLS